MSRTELVRCVCGAAARIRQRDPYIWVECKKKCGMESGFFIKCMSYDIKAEREAIASWNKLVDRKIDS